MEHLTEPAGSRGWGVFFDRDGTLNAHVRRGGRRTSARHEQEWTALPGVQECFGRLRAADALIGVVTNQPDLSRGLLDPATLDRLHRRLGRLDGVWVCPHTARQRCRCRKPSSVLLRRAAARLSVDLAGSYFVGDRPTDAQAALNAGCTAVLLTPRVPARPSLIAGLHYAPDLWEAASTVLHLRRTGAARRENGPASHKETV
ncbi:HAD-IIIA family hydrolase [Streptomyces sp. Ru62]|uniref:D-glycero-alpha-D-manno-heptose-1,7-bisphosphate 7-phosphatase n=1 Tax=Streptomyces sp. Ru62 TaxID=2080745 RepID=UPI0015E39FAA|nr:HAD-IIIA family hydrolase [Streptomyces sp. Ru62]